MVSLMEACLAEWIVFQYSENNELPSVGSAIFKKPFSFCSVEKAKLHQSFQTWLRVKKKNSWKCTAVQPIVMDNETNCAK